MNHLSVVQEYITQGFLHVLPLGFDHILFITSLFFLNTNLKSVIVQCSIFTIAHTITLILGAYQVIPIYANIVEPIIALSIVFTALENIYSQSVSNWRVLLIFIFGLIHGMGFASALQETNIPKHQFFVALLSFNVGVELAQIIILLFLYFAFGKWLQHFTWYKSRVVNPISCCIACVAMYWAVERIL